MTEETISIRNLDIYKRHQQGVTLAYLAREYGITRQRACQIIKSMSPRIIAVQHVDGRREVADGFGTNDA